jgi:hypothetical protein
MKPESLLPSSQDPATDPVLKQMNPFHAFSVYCSKIHSNIILPFKPRYSEWSHSLRFSDQVSYDKIVLNWMIIGIPRI